jgi:hypothetical protein
MVEGKKSHGVGVANVGALSRDFHTLGSWLGGSNPKVIN